MPDANDAGYYVHRAANARALAERATDPSIKAIHTRMAADYDALVREIENHKSRESSHSTKF